LSGGAKVVIGANFPDLVFMDFQKPQGLKTAKSFAPTPSKPQISIV
jgi:hypothetical protein